MKKLIKFIRVNIIERLWEDRIRLKFRELTWSFDKQMEHGLLD